MKRIDIGQVTGAPHYSLGWSRDCLFWGKEGPAMTCCIRFRPHYLQRGLPERLKLHFIRDQMPLDGQQADRLDQLAAYLEAISTVNPALLSAYLNLLVEEVCTLYRERSGISHVLQQERLLLRLLELVEQFFRTETRTAFYAGRLGVVDRKLNELCKKGTGFLVKELIEQRRLEEAEAMLGMGKVLVKTIAAELNFLNGNHFAYWFQQRRGIRPQDYRTMLLNEQ